jgi:hypothetical protein
MRSSYLPDPATGSPGALGWALGLSWFGIMSAGPIAFWGTSQLFAQPPAFLAMLAAVASFPAIGLMMIAGAWRTSWLTAQRLDAAIAILTEEIRRQGGEPENGGPLAKPAIDCAPPQIVAVAPPASKAPRASKTREPLAPAIQGFTDDVPPAPKRAKRVRRKKTMAASAPTARKTAAPAPSARSAAKAKATRPAPAVDAEPPEAQPRVRSARAQSSRPARPEPRIKATPAAESPPPIVEPIVRRTPAPPRIEATRPVAARVDLSHIDALQIEPPPIAVPHFDTAQRAVVDLTAMRRRRRAMRLGGA